MGRRKAMPEGPKTAEELFGVIHDFFEGAEDAVQVKRAWAVLTALRGPDVPDMDGLPAASVKEATTSLIRRRVLGERTMDLLGCTPPSSDCPRFFAIRQDLISRHGLHFADHARRAFEILGLEWDTVNQR